MMQRNATDCHVFVRMVRQVKVSSDWFGSVKTDLVDDKWKTIKSLIKQNINSDKLL